MRVVIVVSRNCNYNRRKLHPDRFVNSTISRRGTVQSRLEQYDVFPNRNLVPRLDRHHPTRHPLWPSRRLHQGPISANHFHHLIRQSPSPQVCVFPFSDWNLVGSKSHTLQNLPTLVPPLVTVASSYHRLHRYEYHHHRH